MSDIERQKMLVVEIDGKKVGIPWLLKHTDSDVKFELWKDGTLSGNSTPDIASYPEKLIEKVNATLNRLDFVSDEFEDRKCRQYILDSVEEWLIDRHKKFNHRKENS